jgi:hypothetical protein
MPDDFNYVNDHFLKIVSKEEKDGCRSLTAEEQVVLHIWHASGIIENGGFQYFFEQELDAEAVALAYETIGCHKCAELLRIALSEVPDAMLRASWKERIHFIEGKHEVFSSLSSGFWAADKEVEKQLAKYIRAHADKICSPHGDPRSNSGSEQSYSTSGGE